MMVSLRFPWERKRSNFRQQTVLASPKATLAYTGSVRKIRGFAHLGCVSVVLFVALLSLVIFGLLPRFF